MKIGLYFGSFNPVHVGHLIIANHFIQYTELQQVWMVVSPHNPLKNSASLLNENHRFHLVQKALEGETKIKASSVEFQLPRPSFTIDTLTYLQEKYPQHEFSVIMGSDSFQNISKWKNYQVLLKNYTIYIYDRPGFPVSLGTEKNIQILQAPLLEISSTKIREMIKTGKSIRYLVPDEVAKEIITNNYYK